MRIGHSRSRLVVVAALISFIISAVGARTEPRGGSRTLSRMHPAVLASLVHATAVVDERVFACQQTHPPTCYAPKQIRAAYGVDRLAADGLSGEGRTIAIIDAFSSPTLRSDLNRFDRLFGLPPADLEEIAPYGVPPFDINDPDQVFWAGEISLDVEWAHAIAPAAKIVLVEAKSDYDPPIEAAFGYAVKHTAADVISQSFSEDEACPDIRISHYHALLAAAARKQITVFAGTGDWGPAQFNCAGTGYVRVAGYPAADPLVTAVGGTRLHADGISGQYLGERAWSEGFAAGGSGVSRKFCRPSDPVEAQFRCRTVPDVSYNASGNSGVLVVWSSQNFGGGSVFAFYGTSAGSPQWSGLVALADQDRHGRIGRINDNLYALAADPAAYRAAFHDVVRGDNRFRAGPDEVFPGVRAIRGYDLATGLGTPRADVLVPLLAARRP